MSGRRTPARRRWRAGSRRRGRPGRGGGKAASVGAPSSVGAAGIASSFSRAVPATRSGHATLVGADADAQLVEQPRREDTGNRLALAPLEVGDRGAGRRAHQAVHRAVVVGQRGEHALGVLHLGRVGRRRHVAVAAAPLLVHSLALELLVQRLLLRQLGLGVAELLLRPLQLLLLLLVPVVHARPEHAAEAADQGAAEDGGAVVAAAGYQPAG